MARARRPEDWITDVANARTVEAELAALLREAPMVSGLEDHTRALNRLDFRFSLGGRGPIWLEVKEKRQRYVRAYTDLWVSAFPDTDPDSLFILDETSFRRLVWNRGFLAVRDVPDGVWWYLGPWHLALGQRVRYQRLGTKNGNRFAKGKVLLSLATGYCGADFDLAVIDLVVKETVEQLEQVAAVALPSEPALPSIG